MTDSSVIVIAGASGYIGKELIVKLREKFPTAKMIALSRTQQESTDVRVQWKACDLFSLRSLEAALPEKIDYAVYLVHSMAATAALDQGSFADYDLILADNFSRAVKKKEVKQLIYLGGLTPKIQNLSRHLQSRLEVEDVFLEYKLPTTVFRAGLILGDSGSSFQILIKLVRRLPLMICPQWTQTLTTPVDLDTVIETIVSSLSDSAHIGKTYDLAGCKSLTYMEMMDITAKKMGVKRFFLSVPFFTPTLSRLWVSLITNTDKNLVYPLVESLEHPMVPRKTHLFSPAAVERSYADLLDKVTFKTKSRKSLFRFRIQRNTVRSVQRLPLIFGKNGQWTKDQYLNWLPRFLKPLIRVQQNGATTVLSFLHTGVVLLELKLNEDRSDPDRQILYIVKGLLVSEENRGRLEFRVVLHRQYVISAIHDFKPALPWFIYKHTQAILHLFVMNSFAKYLTQKSFRMLK